MKLTILLIISDLQSTEPHDSSHHQLSIFFSFFCYKNYLNKKQTKKKTTLWKDYVTVCKSVIYHQFQIIVKYIYWIKKLLSILETSHVKRQLTVSEKEREREREWSVSHKCIQNKHCVCHSLASLG